MPRPVYYSYIRFSTPDQLKGDSLRRQLEGVRAYVEHNGGILDESKTYKDLGVSAYRGANAKDGSKLGAFLKAIETGEVKPGSFLIVEALDRISRNEPMEQFELISKIVKAGISIVTLFDKRVYSREILNTDQVSYILLQTLILRAHEESKTKQKRLQEVWVAKRKSNLPMTGKCPAWLKLVNASEQKVFERITEHCRILEEIFQMAASGVGQLSITKKLNQRGIPSWGTGKRERKGQKTGWHPSYVKKILRNRAVIGEFQPHKLNGNKREPIGEPRPDYYPRVISDELFYRVHGQRKKNTALAGRKSENVHNLFSNLARCGYCGAPMHFKNHGEWQYLVCSKGKRGLGCTCGGWAYGDFETAFLSFMREIDYSNVLTGGKSERITALENALAMKEGLKGVNLENLGRLKALLKENPTPSGLSVLTELDAELEQLKTEVQTLAGELAKARQVPREKVDLSCLKLRIRQPDFRHGLQREVRHYVKRLEVFVDGFQWTPRILESIRQSGTAERVRERFAECLFEAFRPTAMPSQPKPNPIAAESLPDLNKVKFPNRKARFFVVHLDNGAIRAIAPDFANPEKLAVLADLDGGNGESIEMTIWEDLDFSLVS